MKKKNALVRNLLSNFTILLLNGVIGLWLPHYLVNKLGVSIFGLIPLATTIIGYSAIVTVGINGALSRFLAIDIANDDIKAANHTFNTAFTSMGVLMLLLLPLLIIFSTNVSSFISMPVKAFSDAKWLFMGVSIAFVLTSFTAVFNSSAYVANRLDLVNRVTVINTVVRVALVVLIFLFINTSIVWYGIAVLIGSLLASLYSYFLFKKFTPFVNIDVSKFQWINLKSLWSMGSWLIIIQLGNILFLQIDLLVINKILGHVEAGKYSVILQWSNMIRQFSISISGALGPMILTLYAKKEFEQMIKISRLSNKILTLFISCLVAVLCIVSEDLLRLWVGVQFAQMKWLFIAVILPLPINLGVQPLFSLNRAFNKVKVPGLFTIAMGVCNLLLAIFLVRYTDLKLYGVAIASGIILTLKNFIFMPIYVASNMKISKFTFFKASMGSFLILGLSMVLTIIYSKMFKINNWSELVLYSGLLFLLFSGISYLFLNKEERNAIFYKIIKRQA
jgi:O-antigen/teichoic acid export membrane protein